MPEIFSSFFIPPFLMPHQPCDPGPASFVGLHLVSDVLIALANYSIPIALLYGVHKQQDSPFYRFFLLCSLSIMSCGTIHLLEVWTGDAFSWQSGMIKAVIALISLYIASSLIVLIPKTL